MSPVERRSRALVVLLAGVAAMFVAAGGYVHLREWLDVYRDVPSALPGAAVVKVGFPANVATSALAVVAILAVAIRRMRRWVLPVGAAVLAFQVGSLVVLVLTRTGSVLGWSEPTWTDAAEVTRAVEVAAIVALATWLAAHRWLPRTSPAARA